VESDWLYSVFFLNPNTGYAVGDKKILKWMDTLPIPSAPTNLSATNPVNTYQVRLNWNDNANNETGYTVYRYNIPIANLPANTTTYTEQVPVGSYNYKIRALNLTGVSTFSNWASVYVPPDATAPVVTVTSPNGEENWTGGSSKTITYTASDNFGVTKVSAYYTTDGINYIFIQELNGNPGSFNWTVPYVPSTVAKVKVQARDNANNIGSDISNSSFTITVTGCPYTYEPNESITTAYGPIASGTTYISKLCTSTDIDYYKFTTGTSGNINIYCSVPAGKDYDVELLNSSGVKVASGVNGTGAAENFNHNGAAGNYYVKVFGYNGSYDQTNTYTLKATYLTSDTPPTISITAPTNGSTVSVDCQCFR
jgi:hypothetical protein